MTTCTCTPINDRLIRQCEHCALAEFQRALEGLATATANAANAFGHRKA